MVKRSSNTSVIKSSLPIPIYFRPKGLGWPASRRFFCPIPSVWHLRWHTLSGLEHLAHRPPYLPSEYLPAVRQQPNSPVASDGYSCWSSDKARLPTIPATVLPLYLRKTENTQNSPIHVSDDNPINYAAVFDLQRTDRALPVIHIVYAIAMRHTTARKAYKPRL